MKKIIFIIFLFFSIFLTEKNVFAITLDKSSYDYSVWEPPIITSCTQSNSFFNIYDTADLTQAVNPEFSWWVCQLGLDISDYEGSHPFTGHTYHILELSADRICSNTTTSYADCKAKPEFLSEATFFDINLPQGFISVPVGAMSGFASIITTLFTDFWQFILIAISFPLGFYVIRRIVDMF